MLEVRPKKGAAVVYFPETLRLEQDLRTEHEGAEAVDEQWRLSN